MYHLASTPTKPERLIAKTTFGVLLYNRFQDALTKLSSSLVVGLFLLVFTIIPSVYFFVVSDNPRGSQHHHLFQRNLNISMAKQPRTDAADPLPRTNSRVLSMKEQPRLDYIRSIRFYRM